MSELTGRSAATPFHPTDCTCGLCRPTPVAAPAARRWRPSPVATAVIVALLVAVLVGAAVGYRLGRPAGLHCIRSHGTSACYTNQSGPGTVVKNPTDLNAYDTPAVRAYARCLEQHAATLGSKGSCRQPITKR